MKNVAQIRDASSLPNVVFMVNRAFSKRQKIKCLNFRNSEKMYFNTFNSMLNHGIANFESMIEKITREILTANQRKNSEMPIKLKKLNRSEKFETPQKRSDVSSNNLNENIKKMRDDTMKLVDHYQFTLTYLLESNLRNPKYHGSSQMWNSTLVNEFDRIIKKHDFAASISVIFPNNLKAENFSFFDINCDDVKETKFKLQERINEFCVPYLEKEIKSLKKVFESAYEEFLQEIKKLVNESFPNYPKEVLTKVQEQDRKSVV